ncbi:ankyrin repeat-containing domain protein [Mycena polygramma]|nr:ankyrin repeat-containing domain protein [Mycena polygramma]
MADPLSIASEVFELGIAIKESIEKVGENKENLAALKKEVLDTVTELQKLAKGHPEKVPTGELKTALQNLTEQLKTINTNCQALTQSKGISAFLKAWLKRDKVEAEIKKLKENRTNCYTQFQLLSITRVEGHVARTEEQAVLIEATAVRTEGHAARTETNTTQLITSARENEIRKWLQPLDDVMREKQLATQEHRHDDTGSWFLTGTEFVEWKKQPGFLWIRGNSGTGKSVLSSTVINYLFGSQFQPVTPNFAIGYFYFDFRDKEKQLLRNMLRTIMMQLSGQSPAPYSVLNQQFESRRKEIPTYRELLAMLPTILSQFTSTYIVLDALDECSEPDSLVEFISTLRGQAKAVHLLVASQPRTIFIDSAAFEGASVVILEPKTTHADILQFVNSELKLNSKLKHIKRVQDAGPKIVDKSNGMFRMAACLLQELSRTPRVNPDLGRILDELPDDLFGIYGRFLEPIHEDDAVYVATLLRWVAFSEEPVTLHELDDALAIDFSKPDQWVFEPAARGRTEAVLDLLEGLVVAEPDDFLSWPQEMEPVVTLTHSSVKDYIVSREFLEEPKHSLREAHFHTFLAGSCVAYFLHFENNPLNASTLPRYPLAQYAASFWSHHLLRCHDRGVLQRSTMRLLQHGSKQYAALNCVYDIDRPWLAPDWSRHAPLPLHLCCKIDYAEGVEFLLKHGADVNAMDGVFSALQRAVSLGHTDVVRVLLEHGADVNAMGSESGSALQHAAKRGYVGTVRVLLEHGADVNAMGSESGSALQHAAKCGYEGTVRVLLEHGADVNVVGGEFPSALQYVAEYDFMDIVRVLLEHGADVNAMCGEIGSVLQWAARYGHVGALRVLLDHCAEVNAIKVHSALQYAARGGHVDTVRILLDHGADVNAAGEFGSALQLAAAFGHLDVVRMFLNRGVDVDGVSKRCGSALQYAAWRGCMSVVRIILEHGADVNAVGGTWNNALQAASAKGHLEIVRFLLQKGANVNAVGGKYGSALQGAASNGHADVLHALLDYGADVNAAGGKYGSALQSASARGHVDIVRLLIETGADLNAAGGKYGCALEATSAEGHEEIARLLREHGAQDRESDWESD